MSSAYERPLAPCPYCNQMCEADWADVEVGYVQCGPYYCPDCQACQVGPYDTNEISPEEKKRGWYNPRRVGNSCNSFLGTPITHGLAKWLLSAGLEIKNGAIVVPEFRELVSETSTQSKEN